MVRPSRSTANFLRSRLPAFTGAEAGRREGRKIAVDRDGCTVGNVPWWSHFRGALQKLLHLPVGFANRVASKASDTGFPESLPLRRTRPDLALSLGNLAGVTCGVSGGYT